MRILALESSAAAASCAISENGKLLAQYFQNCGLTHSRTLMPMVEDMLSNCELKMSDIDLVAVARGPGSFTGVRIGVAAAKGLAWGAEKPLCGVSTLEAMAYPAAALAGKDMIICCAMDARRNEIYNALFSSDGEKPLRLCADRAVSLETVAVEAENSDKIYLLVGDGAKLCYNHLLEKGIKAILAPPHLVFQSAWGVACAAVGARAVSAEQLSPVYLRLSQAERERIKKEGEK